MNMRTLNTQVRLRRLIRTFAEMLDRMDSDPLDRERSASFVSRLLELTESVREAWELESGNGRLSPLLHDHVRAALRTLEFAIAGLEQSGADLGLLRRDFESTALPLDFFLRGLEGEPALQRSA